MKTEAKRRLINQFYKERIKNKQNEYVHPPYYLEKKLLTAIKLGNEIEAVKTLKEINGRERARLSNNSLRSLKNSIICSCTLFTRACIEGGVSPENAYNLSDVLIQQIEQLETKEDVEEFEYNMVHTFIEMLKEEQIPKYTAIVTKTISYIHEHILAELSLEKIATDLFVNASYLSSIFKKETGTTLINYVNQKKIEESKYFLLHSDISISEIANLFRFCNQSYYTALFKKINGLTPKKFRELEGEY
ncbi:AraC family transcriptional regulator [Bacillus kwashiorkori]|uniref:AraC family transcriptional regulator n=1 Tax=Bacillus kwashiorkori TaxID=1522318 RepID=UPI00078561DA|nr:AraC family transcriptional regulator [Bacillus kwashiorkori]